MRKGFYKSNQYPQRFCEFFTADNGLLSSKALCLGAGEDGTVYIGTDAGLNYTKADGSLGSFACGKVNAIFSFDGVTYFACGNELYAAKNGEIALFQTFEDEIITMSGTDALYLITVGYLYKFEDGKFAKFFHTEFMPTDLAIRGEKITAACGTEFSIVNGKRKHWMTIFHEHSTMPEFKINCIAFDSVGFVWLGTDKGAYVYDMTNGWYGHMSLTVCPKRRFTKSALPRTAELSFPLQQV
ncbi:MAG: hypothetical protein IKK49_08525 [Clostridia bacterium]|nr:hypothetical protein [Clostridia bacterium]